MLIISKLWIACGEERESEYITNDFSFCRRISSRAIQIADSSAVYTLDLSGRRMLLIWFPQITAQATDSPIFEPSVYISHACQNNSWFLQNDSVERLHWHWQVDGLWIILVPCWTVGGSDPWRDSAWRMGHLCHVVRDGHQGEVGVQEVQLALPSHWWGSPH